MPKDAFAAQFPSVLGQGKHHGTPSKTDDVNRLVDMYCDVKVHEYIANSKRDTRSVLTTANQAEDYVGVGAGLFMSTPKWDMWWNDRSFTKATTEIYSTNETN